MSKAIGIDLGSTKSVMAFLKNTRPVVLSNRESSDSTPSIVYLDAHSEPIVGEMAQREGERTPQQTVVSVKRLLGRSFDDPTIQEDIRRASYKVTRAANGECAIELRGRSYTPTEITAFILKSLKEDAENDLGVDFSHAVLTVPVFAGNRQRQAMHEAGSLAGLQVTQLLPESTAAALSYFDGEQQQEPKTLLMYDFGGSSLSITVMLVAAGFFEALGHAGDMHLGGDAFDQMIINWVLDQVRVQHRLELRELPDAARLLFRLKLEAEKAKMRLSRSQSTQILIPDFTRVGSNLIDIDCELTRPEFERMIQPDIDRSLNLVHAAMRQAQVTQGEIDEILLVGGSTHIPAVRQSMQKLWGDRLLRSLIHPLHCVALGAAIRAGDGVKESENPPLYVDMIPRPIGTQSAEGNFLELIPGDTSYPMAAPVTRVFRTATFGQRVLSLPLYEGGDSHLLTSLAYDLPPDLPAGTDVKVAILVDSDGIISATASIPGRPDLVLKTIPPQKSAKSAPVNASPPSLSMPGSMASSHDEEAERENDRWTARVEQQTTVARLAIGEGEGFIPTERCNSILALVEKLTNAVSQNNFSQAELASTSLEKELDSYGAFFILGVLRGVAQNPENNTRVGISHMEQLRKVVTRCDSALRVKDMQSFQSAMAEGVDLFTVMTSSAGDIPMGLMSGGGGTLRGEGIGGGGGGGFGHAQSNSHMPQYSHAPPPPRSWREPERPMENARPQPRPEVPGAVDRVHFSVTAPPAVPPGASFVVDIWAHLEQQRQEVIQRAKAAVGGRDIQIKTKGPLPISRGTVLAVHLKIDNLLIEDPQDTILWEGEIGSASFAVQVPRDTPEGTHLGRAAIYADGVQIARIHFELEVAPAHVEARPLPLQEKRIRTAFASYANPDRDLVLRCVQGMEKAAPFLNIFMDVHSLRSGQKWEQELWQRIPACDIFFLFWSSNASQSPWVEKEWRCALDTHGIDFIDPVPLEPPDVAPPPPELAGLHFNDWELAYQRGKQRG